MRKLLFIAAVLVSVSLTSYAQDKIDPEVEDLASIAEHYKSINSLDLELSYRAYADTLEKTLMDSSTQRFISFNGNTYTSQVNTVSIIKDSLVFFIDHDRKIAYLDRKPILTEHSESSGRPEMKKLTVGWAASRCGEGYRSYLVKPDDTDKFI